MANLCGWIAVALLAIGPTVNAQTPSPNTAPTAQVSGVAVEIPAETTIEVELTEPLSSRTSRIGQTFGLRLSEPINIGGSVVVPAGAHGGGEVIDAHAAAFGGRPGRLIISGRYLEINGERVRIHMMQITATGQNRAAGALSVSMIPYAGIAGIFLQGGNVEIPVGARGSARLAATVSLSGPTTTARRPQDNEPAH